MYGYFLNKKKGSENMKYMSIGYPLKFESNMKYLVEIDEKIVDLNQEEFSCWCYVKSDNYDEIIDRLEKKGVVISGNDDIEIIKKILNKKLIRQGYGLVKDNRHCIYLGENCMYPSKIQSEIWLKANGKNRVMDIFNSLSERYEILFNELEELVQSDLVFVR